MEINKNDSAKPINIKHKGWESERCQISILTRLTQKIHTVEEIGKNRIKIALCILSRVWYFAPPWTVALQAPLSMGFSGKNTGAGCHFLLQMIFPTKGLNPHLLHCRWILLPLSHRGSIICWQFWAKIREKISKNKSISINSGFVAFYHYTEVLMAFALSLRIDHF